MIVRAVQDVFDSAISWATFRLRGGWPVLIGLFLLAGVAIIGLMQLSLAGTHGPNAPPHAALYEYKLWAWWLCVIQSLILGFGAFSAGSSISRDVRSGMMQSNRLMPVRPTVAVWGYLYGAFSTALAPALALFFIGLVVYPRGHHSDLAWIFINLILLLSTALWSTLLALGALINGVLYNTFFIAIGVILMINHSFAGHGPVFAQTCVHNARGHVRHKPHRDDPGLADDGTAWAAGALGRSANRIHAQIGK